MRVVQQLSCTGRDRIALYRDVFDRYVFGPVLGAAPSGPIGSNSLISQDFP